MTISELSLVLNCSKAKAKGILDRLVYDNKLQHKEKIIIKNRKIIRINYYFI